MLSRGRCCSRYVRARLWAVCHLLVKKRTLWIVPFSAANCHRSYRPGLARPALSRSLCLFLGLRENPLPSHPKSTTPVNHCPKKTRFSYGVFSLEDIGCHRQKHAVRFNNFIERFLYCRNQIFPGRTHLQCRFFCRVTSTLCKMSHLYL